VDFAWRGGAADLTEMPHARRNINLSDHESQPASHTETVMIPAFLVLDGEEQPDIPLTILDPIRVPVRIEPA
jgi:hypothetical protein